MPSAPNTPAIPKRRWYVPTTTKFLCGILLMQGVLFLSSHFHWFWFNERKGYTVLITVAATAIGLLLLGSSVLVSRFSPWKAQFGIATLLLMMVVFALPCGWLGREMELARRQRDAVAHLKSRKALVSHQGGISLDEKILRQMRVRTRQATARDKGHALLEYLESVLGKDFFGDVFSITIMEADDEVFESFGKFVQLQALDLQGATVTDDGMKHLRRLPLLKSLNFRGSSGDRWIGDAGVEHLKGLARLEELRLVDIDVTDAGLVHLRELKGLKSLSIDCYRITDQGLLHLSELKELTTLWLLGGRITDDGVQKLREAMPGCRIVAIAYR